MDVVVKAFEEFKQANKDQMRARLILSIDRSKSMELAERTLKMLENYKGNGVVVGLDYSGNPWKNTFTDFQHIFEAARAMGYKTTIHIAELEGEVC